jgi:sarcosine oxidase subunit gamma
VSVTVLRHSLSGAPAWRVWCDYTAGTYLWETLVGIAEELGGGAAGITAAWPALQAG